MTFSQALSSALQFFVVFLFLSIGLVLNCLPFLPHLREKIAHFILEDSEALTLFGLFFFMGAFFLFLVFFILNRGKYLRIQMGGKKKILIDRKVIRKAVSEVLAQQKIELLDLEITFGSELEIEIALPQQSEEKLKEIEKNLSQLLEKQFGVDKPFYLRVRSA